MRLVILMAAAGLVAGCQSLTSFESVAETQWRTNSDKWRAAGISSYQLQMRSECFCGEPTGSVRIVVQNGTVQSRTMLDTDAPVEAGFTKWFPDVPGLFGAVRNALDRKATYLATTYDPTYGYPTTIRIDFSGGALGDKENYYVESFTVLK